MIKLTKEQILKLHSEIIKTTGGSDGIRDIGLLESALETPFQSYVEKNYIRVFRQRQKDYVMDW